MDVPGELPQRTADEAVDLPRSILGGAVSLQGRSLGLSVMAMCLLNGEIVYNGNNDMTSVAGLTVSEVLNRLMFREFNAPEDDTRRLTFNKGCRLTDVELTAGGIAT